MRKKKDPKVKEQQLSPEEAVIELRPASYSEEEAKNLVRNYGPEMARTIMGQASTTTEERNFYLDVEMRVRWAEYKAAQGLTCWAWLVLDDLRQPGVLVVWNGPENRFHKGEKRMLPGGVLLVQEGERLVSAPFVYQEPDRRRKWAVLFSDTDLGSPLRNVCNVVSNRFRGQGQDGVAMSSLKAATGSLCQALGTATLGSVLWTQFDRTDLTTIKDESARVLVDQFYTGRSPYLARLAIEVERQLEKAGFSVQ